MVSDDAVLADPETGAPADGPEHLPPDRSSQAAAIAFAAYLGIAFFVLFRLGRRLWFYSDDWNWFLRPASVEGLFTPYFQHWVTLPLLVYRFLFRTFGANYTPFLISIIALHLTLAVLLRVIMRRAGVSPWIATVAAGTFVLFGSGREGILVSIQISLVGSAVLGLCHVLLADHDGRFDRRDALGLACGVLGLMSSGIGTIMIVIVGIAVFVRRGWLMALIHTVPLVIVNSVWYYAERASLTGPTSKSPVREAIRWDISGERAVFDALGGSRAVAIALAVLLVVGLFLAWVPLTFGDFRKRSAVPLALLLGGPTLFALVSVKRSYLANYETTQRFINLAAAFALPALAVGADAIARRWRVMTPVVLIVLVLGVPSNLRNFPLEEGHAPGWYRHEMAMLIGAAYAPSADRTPPDLQPYNQTYHAPGVTMGFLVDARKNGRLPPAPHLTTAEREELLVRLGVQQLNLPIPKRYRCQNYNEPLSLRPAKGDIYVLDTYVTINYGDRVDTDSHGADLFYPATGKILKILLPDLHLTISNFAGPTFGFNFCKGGEI